MSGREKWNVGELTRARRKGPKTTIASTPSMTSMGVGQPSRFGAVNRMPADAAQTRTVPLGDNSPRHDLGSIRVFPGPAPTDQEFTQRAMSASGAGTVSLTYTPEASDTSTKIVFIQVMKELLDGKMVKPSEAASSFAYQDADTTSLGYHVDYVSGENDPYYNGDDPQDFGTQGNALTGVNATSSDTPNYGDASFPSGKTKLTWEFRTSAFSAAGADAGIYYGFVDWKYEKEKGKPATTSVGGTMSGHPGVVYLEAIDLWNKNHGFTMPIYTPTGP